MIRLTHSICRYVYEMKNIFCFFDFTYSECVFCTVCVHRLSTTHIITVDKETVYKNVLSPTSRLMTSEIK